MEIAITGHDKNKVWSNKTILLQRPIAVMGEPEQGKQQQKKAVIHSAKNSDGNK